MDGQTVYKFIIKIIYGIFIFFAAEYIGFQNRRKLTKRRKPKKGTIVMKKKFRPGRFFL